MLVPKIKKAHENFMSLPIKVIVMNYFLDEIFLIAILLVFYNLFRNGLSVL